DLVLVGAVERDPDARRGLAALGLAHRAGAHAAATDGATTTHEKLLRRSCPGEGGSRNYAPRLMSRPSTTTATIPTSAVTTVSRSRLRSTTDDPPREEVTPPPNRSDRPPPLPLCSSTSIRRRTLQTITRMDRPRITRSPVTRPRRGGMDDLGPQDRVLAARLGLGPGGG